jgi:hypothetical protein
MHQISLIKVVRLLFPLGKYLLISALLNLFLLILVEGEAR